MKKLYIRFYVNAESKIPFDSAPVIDQKDVTPETLHQTVGALRKEELDATMVDWMIRHPNGKVDYVWL